MYIKMENDSMKLSYLKGCLETAWKDADGQDVDVEVWQGDKQFEIESVRQFSLIKDVVIALKEDLNPV